MKLNQLEALIAIADGKGMSGAAKKLNISQPAITKSLSNLEYELDVPLFDRSGYRLKLNEFGNILLTHARAISSEIEMARREIKISNESKNKIIRLSCSPGVLPKTIPRTFQHARQIMPDLMIEICGEMAAADEVKFTELAEGVSDLLIYPADKSNQINSFIYTPLLDVNIIILASKNHPATKMVNPTLRELIKYEWIFPASKGLVAQVIKNAFADLGLPLPEKHLNLPDRQILLSFLQSGEYLAFLPSHPAMLEDQAKNLPTINIQRFAYGWTIYIIQRQSSVNNDAMSIFIESLHEIVDNSF
jgi:LysR family transcriptional regulator of abg operon